MKLCLSKKFPINFNNLLYEFIKEEKRGNSMEMAAKLINLWKPEKSLKVSFDNNSDPKLIEEILFVANEWSRHCSMFFIEEKKYELSDIYVSLKKGFGFYSAIGLQSKVFIAKNKPSMNLDPNWGLESGFSTKKELRYRYCKSMVMHEFGHALGLIHEHQREDRPFSINVKYVKNNFEKLGMPSYDAAKENIIKTYQNINVSRSRFDYKSIMIYPLTKNVISENFKINIPYNLSKIDKIKIGKIYP